MNRFTSLMATLGAEVERVLGTGAVLAWRYDPRAPELQRWALEVTPFTMAHLAVVHGGDRCPCGATTVESFVESDNGVIGVCSAYCADAWAAPAPSHAGDGAMLNAIDKWSKRKPWPKAA